VRFGKKRKRTGIRTTKGLDIYRLPHGTTVQNALDGTNGAEHWYYEPGSGPNSREVPITIRPQDLGMLPSLGSRLMCAIGDLVGMDFSEAYEIKASKIYALIEVV
jgi:hypothetical protein